MNRRELTGEALRVFGLLLLLFTIRWLPEVLGLRAFIAEDFPVLNLPVRAWLGESLRHGILPYWTELLQGGYPLFAESQAGATYPLRLLHALPVAPWTVLAWTFVLHLAWAGTGLHLYLRQHGLRLLAAFLAALAFSASTTLLARHQHTNVLEAVSWWPWLLFLADHAVRSSRSASWLGLGAATGLMAMCGHAQFVVYGATLAGLEAIRELALQPRGQRVGRVPGLLLAGLLAAGLAAPQYLPLLELRPHSLRAEGVWEVGDQTLKPQHLPLLLAPGFWGPMFDPQYARPAQRWEVVAYLGTLPLLLAGIALRGRQPLVKFWAVIGALAILGAVGERLPVVRLLDLLPGWSAFRAPARLITIFALALAILAAFGAERVASGDWRWTRRWWTLTRLVVVALALAVPFVPALVQQLERGAGATSLFSIASFGMFIMLSLGWLHLVGAPEDDSAWMRSVRRALDWRRSPLLAAIGLVGIDLALAGMALTPTVPAAFYRQRPPVPDGRIAVGPGRDPNLFWYQPDTNLLLGAANLHNMSPLALANQVRLLEAGLADGTLDQLHVLLGVGAKPGGPGHAPLETIAGARAGYVAAVWRWHNLPVDAAVAAVAEAPRVCWIVPIVTGECRPPAPTALFVEGRRSWRATPNRLVWNDQVDHGASTGGWLTDQTPYPGWRAYVGAEPAQLCPANVVQSLVLSQGSPVQPQFVRLVFAPLTIRLGLFISALTLACGAMVLCAAGSVRDE